MKKNTKIVCVLLLIAAVIIVIPFFLTPQSEFSGSDNAGKTMVEQIEGENYEPWFSPLWESLTGAELPGEMETLFFCLQTGLGVGVFAYCFGYLVARKKYSQPQNKD